MPMNGFLTPEASTGALPYDCIIISDLHLGSDVCPARLLDEFLEWAVYQTSELVINGDIFDDLVTAAKKAVAAGNWTTAQQELDAANTLKANDPSVASLTERLQHQKAYEAAMAAAQQAFENTNYDEAIRQAQVARARADAAYRSKGDEARREVAAAQLVGE